MKQAYSIFDSKFLVTNINRRLKKSIFGRLRKILWIIFTIVMFVSTCFIFYKTLYPCGKLFDVISLGAVFATLGSTMVSIASLLCNKYYEEFTSCLNILRNELLNQNITFKWLFLKKQEVIKKSKGEYVTYQSSNPKVIFEIGTVNLSIEIPVQKKDFYELELLKKILRMKATKHSYITYLLNHTDSVMESGLYIWECTYHILCSAFLYKFYRNLIIVGTLFFVSGLMVTFLYAVFI